MIKKKRIKKSKALTYNGSPSRTFTKAKQGYCSSENTADRAMTRPYSFPKWHDGKLNTQSKNKTKRKIIILPRQVTTIIGNSRKYKM